MKKLFTIGFVASALAISIVACNKNNNVNPISGTKGLTTFIKKDTVTPPRARIAIRDTVTPPAKNFNSLSILLKKDTVTPPRANRLKRDTVTPPRAVIAIRDTVTPPRK